MVDNHSIENLVAELAKESAAYSEKSRGLESALDGLVPDPADAVSDLLSWADEFGREHAIELFQNDLHTYPSDPQITGELWPQRARDISAAVDALLDGQDKLDQLTRARDLAQGRNPHDSETRTLNIQGQDYELDGRSMQLRNREGASHSFDEARSLSLTQSHARDVGADVAQAQRESPDRTRGRSR
jgi:hypothetical protein